MIDWVHSDSSDNWEVLSLSLVSPVLDSSLQDWLFISSSSSYDSDHSSRLTVNGLSDTRWKFDSGLETIFRVSNDSDKSSRGSGKLTIVTFSELNVGNESTFRDLSNREDVTNLEGSFLSTEDSLSREHTFDSKVKFLDLLVVIRIFELDSGNRSSSSWIVKDFFNNTLDKSVSLLIVQVFIFDLSKSSEHMRLVNRIWSSLSLRSDGSSHSVYNFFNFQLIILNLRIKLIC
jgi:hypothetical protein